MLKVAPKLPLQPLFPLKSASQLPDEPEQNRRAKLGSSPGLTVTWGAAVVAGPAVMGAENKIRVN